MGIGGVDGRRLSPCLFTQQGYVGGLAGVVPTPLVELGKNQQAWLKGTINKRGTVDNSFGCLWGDGGLGCYEYKCRE